MVEDPPGERVMVLDIIDNGLAVVLGDVLRLADPTEPRLLIQELLLSRAIGVLLTALDLLPFFAALHLNLFFVLLRTS